MFPATTRTSSGRSRPLGEKEHWGKFTTWERAARVPLVISLPAKMRRSGLEANARCGVPVGLIDIYPTLLDLAGLEKRADLNGTSLVPLLKDPAMRSSRLALTTVGRGNHSLRNSRWRYIHYFDGAEELYDHVSDPDERHNLAGKAEHEALLARMRRHLPSNEEYLHLVRMGQWKAVIQSKNRRLSLYGPGVAILQESKDVSGDHPDVVRKIQTFLKNHPDSPKYLRIED